MNLFALTARLRARGIETPDTSVLAKEVSGVSLPQLVCTPDTSDTSQKAGTVPLDTENHFVPVEATAPPVLRSIMRVQREVDPRAFDFRHTLFMSHHISPKEAGNLANRLDRRDIEYDNRRLCLECVHLSGPADERRCDNWRLTGMRGPAIPADQVDLLQRCVGFDEKVGPASTAEDDDYVLF